MSEENNGGNGTGKPYAAMTPEERSRLMDFMLNQQAQFFADITEMKAVLADLLKVNDKHERRLERAENILRSAVVIGQRTRTELRTQGRTNQAEIAQLIQVQAYNEALAQRNSEQIAANAEAIKENAEVIRDLAATVNQLAVTVNRLAERNGNGGA